MRVQHEQLSLIGPVGAGSQGSIYRVEHSEALGFPFPLIYKEFAAKTAVSGAALELLASFRANQQESDRRVIDQRTVWPCAAVARATRICGYVMQAIPDTYMQTIQTMTGTEPIPREVQHLFVSDAIARKNIGEIPKRTERFALAREMAFTLGFLHKRELVFGDLSYKNAVYTLRPTPMIMLLDCDAVRFKGQGAAVSQLNSPGWGAPEKGPQTIESDRYKLALFILRCLTPGVNAQNRDPEVAQKVFDAEGMALLRRGLGDDRHARPSGKEWVAYLDERIANAGGVQARTGTAARPAPPPKVAVGHAEPPVTSPTARPFGAPQGVRGKAVPYQLPPKTYRPPAAVQPGQWVQPHRVPSHVRSATSVGGPLPLSSTGQGPYTPVTSLTKKQRRLIRAYGGLVVIAVVVVVSLLSSSNTSSKSVPTTRYLTPAPTAPGTTTDRVTDERRLDDSAMSGAAMVLAAAGDGWTLRWVAAGDQNAAFATLGGFRTAPSMWTFVITQPPRHNQAGGIEQHTRKYTVAANGSVRLVFDLITDVASGRESNMAMPADWASSMRDAADVVAAIRPTATKVAYAWVCDAGATSVDRCVWRFTFDGSSANALYVSPGGERAVARPTWLP